MSQVSKQIMNRVVENQIKALFERCIVLCKNKSLTRQLLYGLLTPTERVMLAKRFSIAYMLEHGYKYDDISLVLKVSSSTIRTVATSLREDGGGLNKIIKKIKREESVEETLNAFVDIVELFFSNARGVNRARYNVVRNKEKGERSQMF